MGVGIFVLCGWVVGGDGVVLEGRRKVVVGGEVFVGGRFEMEVRGASVVRWG